MIYVSTGHSFFFFFFSLYVLEKWKNFVLLNTPCLFVLGYYLKWQNEEILVHRADVECTNGIIHVLDGVFLKESDIRVTAGVSGVMLSSSLQLFVTILAPFLFKWLLG